IPKPGKKKMRPIDTPTQKDRIIQEALRGILEAIYEPEFKEFEEYTSGLCSNYGFRPRKSTWDAVAVLKYQGQSTNYCIEGDIVGAYNNIDHNILLNILERRIKDKKFLKLINNLLKAGIMEENRVIHNLIGTPQGGILSPLLFNIYMFEFDKFIYEEIIKPLVNNNSDKKSRRNPIHSKISRDIKN
ncbi:MAG: RNA-directed DNA polymerase, partial [Scytonema sp. CRU_2_7]|nr:RNA-directed DNA polymerase [Scytonema sp. CRU_2_7]